MDPAIADTDFGTTWYTFGGAYNGPAFTAARPAPFHYGGITYFTNNGLTGTLIGVGGTATAPTSGLRYSAYFKKQFTAAANFTGATAEVLIDDGAVVYLDGVEIRRYNMTGTVAGNANGTGDSYPMLADGASDETQLTTLSLGNIAAGTHTLAISLHNAATNSSDIGLYFRLLGSAPPPPVIVRTSLGGTLSDIRQDAATLASGWASTTAPGGFRLSAPGTAVRTIESQNIDLTTIGAVNFSVLIYHYENSGTSNFELADEFSAKLAVTYDDNSTADLPLLDGIIDANADGKLTEEEFNFDLVPVTGAAYLTYRLTAALPANVKTARLSITGLTDSASEVLSFGGALISDFAPDHDSDKDGDSDALELFNGTNPANGASIFTPSATSVAVDAGTGNTLFTFTMNNVAGRRYAAEDTDDLFLFSHIGTVVAGTAGGPVTINLGTAPPSRYMFRIRPVP